MPKGVFARKPGGNNNNWQHGQSYTTTYVSWRQMLNRCRNPNVEQYQWYGARGIKVCERWEDFKNFYADMGDRPQGTSIDRIDNDGDYEPSNCRWASHQEQQRNRSNNTLIAFDGVTATMTEWAERVGIAKVTLCARLTRYDWTIERALTTPAAFKSQSFRSKS